MKGPQRGPIGRSIREALDAVVAPAVAERLIADALLRGQLVEVPEEPTAFRDFLVPFRDVSEECLGEATAASLVDELSSLAERAITSMLPPARSGHPPRSRQRVSSPPQRLATPPPVHRRVESGSEPPPHWRLTPQRMHAVLSSPSLQPGAPPSIPTREFTTPPDSTDLPRGLAESMGMLGSEATSYRPEGRRILLCSGDSSLAGHLGAWAGSSATVVACPDLMALVRLIGVERCVVFLDCRHPTIRPMSLAAVSEELPNTVDVVLWAATPALVEELTQLFAAARKWIVCSSSLGIEQAIVRCVQLMG